MSIVPFYRLPNRSSLPLLWAQAQPSDVLHREESNCEAVRERQTKFMRVVAKNLTCQKIGSTSSESFYSLS